MKAHKRLLLITAIAGMIFAAIAVGPYKRAVSPVRADPVPAVVLLVCGTPTIGATLPLTGEIIYSLDSSDPTVTLSSPPPSCATELNSLINKKGFRRLETTGGPFAAGVYCGYYFSSYYCSFGDIINWTLVRGTTDEEWNAH